MGTTLLWLRRDLRIHDNRALLTAAKRGAPIIAVFIFDNTILRPLTKTDRRITFICQALQELQYNLAQLGIPLYHHRGDPRQLIPKLASEHHAQTVICSEDYEPQAITRDQHVKIALNKDGCDFQQVTDQVIFAKNAILTQQNTPYNVFTPYKRAWLKTYVEQPQRVETLNLSELKTQQQSLTANAPPIPNANELGFQPYDDQAQGGETTAQQTLEHFLDHIDHYASRRDYPALNATSHLSPYLRFGCLSIRQLVSLAIARQTEGADTWLSELIWREFYQQHLYHNPDNIERSWRAQYRAIPWENNPDWLHAWQHGETGYPLIDAAMRCLKITGTMHNRLRMITASFLCKDLLCDWRLGEQWFAQHLLDYDLAANNGGWQWAASTGCDAQPYFRIFNPETQSKKFDPNGNYIRHWLPELAHLDNKHIHNPPLAQRGNYPTPIVDHATQRQKAIALYKTTAEAYHHFM